MVAIFVLLTFALIIVIRLYLNARRVTEPVKKITSENAVAPLKYFHPGHTWIQIEEPSSVKIGIINFVKELIGKVHDIQFPQKGTLIKQGDVLLTLKHNKRFITIYSPLSGQIEETQMSLSDPKQENGWLVKLSPSNLTREVRNLMSSSNGLIWQDALRMQLAELFSPKVGPVLQDGGTLIPDFIDHLSDEEWEKIQKVFFNREIQ